MRKMMGMAVVIMAVVACTPTKVPPADTTGVVTVPELDSTVQHKIPPDTLVRGDGAKCVVRPATKYDVAELGQPFICDWRK